MSKKDLLLSKPLASQSHTNWSRLVLPGQRAQGRKGHGVSGHFLKTDQVPSQNPRPGSSSHHPRAGAGTGAAQLQPLASWSEPQSLELSLLGHGKWKPQGSSVCLNKERGQFAADTGHRYLAKAPSGAGWLRAMPFSPGRAHAGSALSWDPYTCFLPALPKAGTGLLVL